MRIRKFCRYILLLLVLTLNNNLTFGTIKDSLLIEKFYQCLYHYKFQSADSLLRDLSNQKTSPQITGILHISYTWWQIISGEDSQDQIDRLFREIDSTITYFEKNRQKSVLKQDEIPELIVLYSYKSRLHNYKNNRLPSFSAFKQSFNYFEKLEPCDSGYCDMYNFIAGMYYALGGHLQEQFSAIFLLGLNKNFTDTEKGYKLLKQSANSENKQIRTESIYFLMKLYFEVQHDPVSASKYSGNLVNLFPDNLVFRYNHILILHEQGKYEAAERAYSDLLKHCAINNQLTVKQKEHFQEEYRKLKRK